MASALFAFLHHVAAFTLVAALAIEFVLVRGDLTLQVVRTIQRADIVFGASAGVLLVVGLVRVFYLEGRPGYYFHSVPFIAKLTLFVIVALLSIYPTLEFLRWRKAVNEGQAPVVDDRTLRSVRAVIHWELAGVALLILCAVLAARTIGYVG
jgi:putative membrane protein